MDYTTWLFFVCVVLFGVLLALLKIAWLLGDITNSPIAIETKKYLMPLKSFCDIDTQTDFEVAEFLHRKYYIE